MAQRDAKVAHLYNECLEANVFPPCHSRKKRDGEKSPELWTVRYALMIIEAFLALLLSWSVGIRDEVYTRNYFAELSCFEDGPPLASHVIGRNHIPFIDGS